MAASFGILLVWILAIAPQVRSAPLINTNEVKEGHSAPPLIYITLEEHYDPKAILPLQVKDPVYDIYDSIVTPELTNTLRNISVRIPDMDANGIKMQVLGNDPQPYALSDASAIRKTNDELAQVISEYPDRFRGFCYLPMEEPAAAAHELRRCIREHKFLGALTDGHTRNNLFYDSKEYDVLWSAFEELDVPFYMHPTYAQISQVNESGGLYTPDQSYSDVVASALSVAGWGWHSDNGLAFVRMWLGGVFDRHPKFKLVLGHMGEMVPYMLHRVEYALGSSKPKGVTVLEAWANNVWVTTSGFFSLVPFRTLQAATAMDRIMYSVDYPWGLNANGTTFMEALKTSGLVSKREWEAIAYGNAVKLLRL